MRFFFFTLAMVGALPFSDRLVGAAERPNVVVILADDLGWNAVGYHSDWVRTPNIDRLANVGIDLDRFYVAPMCTPTRAGLLTGRYPIRFGLARAVIPPHRNFGLPTEERTLAEALRDAGYKHRGVFGKWHLGQHQVHLYAMPGDLLEKDNVAGLHPTVVEQLFKKLVAYRSFQPENAIPVHREGREGFKPWKNWRLRPGNQK